MHVLNGLMDHLKLKSMGFIYWLFSAKSPSYLFESIQSGRLTRTRQLVAPWVSDGSSLFVRGIVDWNALTIGVRYFGSLDLFRKRYVTQ